MYFTRLEYPDLISRIRKYLRSKGRAGYILVQVRLPPGDRGDRIPEVTPYAHILSYESYCVSLKKYIAYKPPSALHFTNANLQN